MKNNKVKFIERTDVDRLRDQLYHLAKKNGYKLELCRSRNKAHPYYQTFRILDRSSNKVVYRTAENGYGVTLEQAEKFLNSRPPILATPKADAATTGKTASNAPQTTAGIGDVKPAVKTPKGQFARAAVLSSKFIVLGDTFIPAAIVDIFNCLDSLDFQLPPGVPRRISTAAEDRLMTALRNAKKLLATFSNEDLRLYMFARLVLCGEMLKAKGHPNAGVSQKEPKS